MNFNELFKKRYTAKVYKENSTKIPQEHINLISEAIRFSPSSTNLQNARAIFVSNKEIKNQISSYYMEQNQKIVKDVPLIILFIGIPVDDLLESDGKYLWTHLYEDIDKDIELKKQHFNIIKNMYQSQKNSANYIYENLDLITSITQWTYAMNQATDLGYNTTSMSGLNYIKLNEYLRNNNYIKNNERIIISLAVGKAEENNQKNESSKIKKRINPKKIINIID